VAVSAILGFWAVAAPLIIVPGPDWAFAISAGLGGRIVPATAGIVVGYLTVTALLAAGGGALVAASPAGLTVLSVLGGGYLVWLGFKTFLAPAAPIGPSADHPDPLDARAVLVRGIGVSGLNPKGLLTLVAVLPQFADPASVWPMAVQLCALGLVFTLTCAVVYLIVGSCSRRVLGTRPGIARIVSRVSGVCMIVIGAALILEHFLRYAPMPVPVQP
jgi:threonine/homoserine/homoserine lactone efflux protein